MAALATFALPAAADSTDTPLPSSADECHGTFSQPQCLARPYPTFDSATYSGNGLAKPAVAKDVIAGYPAIHAPQYVNDGYMGNGSSWIAGSANSWIKIDLGQPTLIDGISFGRDRTGNFDDRDPGVFSVATALTDDHYQNGSTDPDSQYITAYTSDHAVTITGAETVRAAFTPVLARFVKLTVANSGAAIDELKVSKANPNPLDISGVGLSLSTAAQANKTCLNIDKTKISVNLQPRDAQVSGCIVGENRYYTYTDTGDNSFGTQVFGSFNGYYVQQCTGGGIQSVYVPPDTTQAQALAACQTSRNARIASLDAQQNNQFAASNYYACWNPRAYVNVAVAAPAAQQGDFVCNDLSTLSGGSIGNVVMPGDKICVKSLNNDWASAVLTKVDWRPQAANSSCLDVNGSGAALAQACNAAPNWLAEPTPVADVIRLRRNQSSGQCLEFDTATSLVKTTNCRARYDVLFNRQAWQLLSASGGNKLLQNKASPSLCLTYNNGGVVAQTCPADITTATAQQLWQMAQPAYGPEHWNAATDPQAGFVMLTEPTASTMPVYQGARNKLYLCNDNGAACGAIAFYTVLPPALTSTPSATDALRVPVYEFATANSAEGYRYSTSLDIGSGWLRQPNIAFYAYQNLNDTESRVTEVLGLVERVFLGYNAGAQPGQQITVPNLVSIASGNVSYQYAAGSPGQFTVISNTAQRPDREELLHVAGHLVIDSMLGPMLDIDRCDYTVDATAGTSDLHRPRDILSADSQSDACAFREGWTEFFTSQMLAGKTSLANFANTGGVLFDSDHVGQSLGRRQLNSALAGFITPVPTLPLPFLIAATAINAYFLENYLVDFNIGGGDSSNVIIETPKKAGPESTMRDNLSSSSQAQSAYSHCLVAQGRYADSNATACDFSAYLNDDPQSSCEVIDPSNHVQKENCHNPHRIQCTNGSTITATSLTYPLYQAPLACTTLGPAYIPSAGTNSSGAIVGDGKAEEPPTKRVRLIAGPPDPEAVAFVEAKVKPAIADPRFAFLLVHSLNVGSGSCHIVECVAPPSTPESVIVDCGSNSSQGDHVLKQVEIDAYLEDLRLFADPAKYPALVVTHPDKDHYKYAADIFINRKPSRVWLGGYPGSYKIGFPEWINTFFNQPGNTVQVNGATSSVPPAARWAALPTPAGYAQVETIKTFAACGGATLKMVTVNNGNGGATDNNRNVNSAVLKVEWGNRFVAVISGDATGATETAASLALDGSVAVPRPALTHDLMRLLVVSHHGADTEGSSSVAWIQRINPTHAVYSAGSKFGHPRCTIFDRMDLTALVLGSDQVHDLACGVDTNNANRQLRQPVKNQFSTRESGTVVGGVAIPIGTNNNLPPYAIFETDLPH